MTLWTRWTRQTLRTSHCKEDIMDETMSKAVQFFVDRARAALGKEA